MSAKEFDTGELVAQVNSWLIRELKKKEIPWVRPWADALVRVGGRCYPLTDWPSNIRSPDYLYAIYNYMLLQFQMRRPGTQEFRSNLFITTRALDEIGVKKPKERRFVIYRGWPSSGGLPKTPLYLYHVEQVKNYEKFIGFSLGDTRDHNFSNEKSKKALDNLKHKHSLRIKEGQCYAAFQTITDHVVMPSVQQFIEKQGKEKGESHYWATMWHEVIHWTGHRSRLNRPTAGESNLKDYAMEELVAETGAAYLCAHFGVKHRKSLQHGDYIKNYLKVLETDKEVPYQVLVDAQKAATWVVKNCK